MALLCVQQSFPEEIPFVRELRRVAEKHLGSIDEHREQTVAAIVRESAELVSRSTDDAGLAFDLSTNVTTARRSG